MPTHHKSGPGSKRKKTGGKAVTRAKKPDGKKAAASKPRNLADLLSTELYGPPPRGPLPTAVPTAAEIDEALASLPAADLVMARQILNLVSSQLGSPDAGRLWMVTPFTDFPNTPMREITTDGAAAILACLEDRWGPGAVFS